MGKLKDQIKKQLEDDYEILRARNESDKKSKLKYFRENLSLLALSSALDAEAAKALKAKGTRTPGKTTGILI